MRDAMSAHAAGASTYNADHDEDVREQPERALDANAAAGALFGCAAPLGRPSLSPSMLIERYEFSSDDWHTHLHADQVVAMYFKPTRVRHVLDASRETSSLALGPRYATICQRERSESVFWEEAASFLCVRISDAVLDEAARFSLGRERIEIEPTGCVMNPTLTGLLHVVEAERERGYPTGRLFLDSVEKALAAALVSSHAARTRSNTTKIGGLSPYRFRRVVDFMTANVDAPVSLEDLAQCAELSVSHFSHQFRQSANVSPHRFMLQLRIDRAKALLENRQVSILETALAVGFENQQHFATVFRRLVGKSPSAFRRSL